MGEFLSEQATTDNTCENPRKAWTATEISGVAVKTVIRTLIVRSRARSARAPLADLSAIPREVRLVAQSPIDGTKPRVTARTPDRWHDAPCASGSLRIPGQRLRAKAGSRNDDSVIHPSGQRQACVTWPVSVSGRPLEHSNERIRRR